jgi:predicted RNA-binding protein (virulence factor B family)
MENKPKYELGQKVELLILRETDLGFVAQVNDVDEGLLYHGEIFETLESGQAVPGYIKKIREDGLLDLVLQPFGNLGSEDLARRILETLQQRGGFLPINDKTIAEEIYELFGVSKKKYKMALGHLYKRKLILIKDDGIYEVKGSVVS